MSYVRRMTESPHRCDLPMGSFGPYGADGDLYRCDVCGTLWRLGDACDACEAYGPGRHRGQCRIGQTWRPATLWQRIRYRRHGRPATVEEPTHAD
jgi:hypothetical protein